MLALLVIIALGGGGYWFYQRRAAAAERAETIDKELTTARSALAAADPNHWGRAATAVQHVLDLQPDNGDALAIGAEAALANVLDTGMGGPMKLGSGRRMLADAISAGAKGPQVARAQALGAIAANQADKAVEMLKPLVAQSPKDPFLALYMGWAQAGANASADAVKSFDIAMAAPATKTSALYARGRAKLAAGDLDGARADFTALLETAKDHIGAQVGLAAALPASQAPQRESDLLAILSRKDIASGDPRAVALAWSLAADDARRAGRFDSARERYRKALALQDKDAGAMTGLADVELRDGKLDAASEMITKAIAASATYVPALTVGAEIAIAQNRLDDAAKTLDDLVARENLAPLDAAHVKLVLGKLRETQGKEDEALDAYVDSAKLAGDLDLAPRMAAVTKLMTAAHKAADAKDKTRATELRERGDQLLGGLVDSAQRDPAVAMTLGVAYLEANDPAKAETWLRHVVDARPDDVGARFQLAKVVARLGRIDEALGDLKSALDKEPARMDIALELARTYESAGRNDEAVAAYDKLLASPDVGLELRGYAGRFFIKLGQIAKGAAQGDEIAKLEPFNPVGMYLRAEGQFAAGNVEEAAKLFKRAADAEPDPVYLEGWGRAAEAQAIQSNDMRFQDVALRAYTQANTADPAMFGPLVGLGRIYLARHEAAKAVQPLLDASKIKPNDPDVAFGIGAAYQELQQKAAAIKWLELSAREKPRAEARWRLGQLYYDGQHDHEASSNLAAAVKLANDDEKATGKKPDWLTDALYDLGSIYLALHNDNGARDAWNRYLDLKPKNAAQVNEVKYKMQTELRR
jgi:tetratricopeptide (TPR) repeat protein